MTMREVRWERMFLDELEAAFAACPVVYFTYGLCEPHGPQNALGLDELKAHAIACRAAHEHGGIVAPADFWHIHELAGSALWAYHTIGEVPRTWLTAIPPWQHFKNVLYHVRAADAIGFHAAIFLTGHYGAMWMDLRDMLVRIQPHVGVRIYGLPDFEANTPGFLNDGKSSGDHAGRVETSLLWALEPELTDYSRIPPPDAPGPHFAMGHTVRESDRRIGERMVADEVRYLGDKARELLAAYDAAKPAQRMLTFDDTERVWDEVVRPTVPDMRCMNYDHTPDNVIPETSRWHANWQTPKRGW
jgi:creatinine amidohydrolase